MKPQRNWMEYTPLLVMLICALELAAIAYLNNTKRGVVGQFYPEPPQQHEQQNKEPADKLSVAHNDQISAKENRAACSDSEKRDECAVALRGAVATERQADYALYALWGIGFTFAFSAFASWAAWQALRVARAQATSTLDQVGIMRSEQRPWVLIDSMIATGDAIAVYGELTIPIELHLKNVGTKLATEIRAKFYPFFAGAWAPILMEKDRIIESVPAQTSDPTTIFLAPGDTDKIRHVMQFAWNGDEHLLNYTTILAVVTYDVSGQTGVFGCAFTVSSRDLLVGGEKPPGIEKLDTIQHWHE